jgi:hypothetical protein
MRYWAILLACALIAAIFLRVRQPDPAKTVLVSTAMPAPPTRSQAAVPAQEGNVSFQVTGPDGRPLESVPVRLWSRGIFDPALSRFRWLKTRQVLTGADGSARTTLQPGTYLAAAHAAGLAPALEEFAVLPTEPLTVVAIQVQAPVSVRGRTQDAATHEPVPQAKLTFVPAPSELALTDVPEEEQSQLAAGNDGGFTARLSPGIYRIDAEAPGYGQTHAHQVQVPSAGETLVLMRGAAFVQGRVLLPDGTGAAHAQITASREAEPCVAQADARGAFSLQLEPGPLQLSARLGGLTAKVNKPLAVRSGETLDVGVLRLHAAGSIAARVVDREGKAVAGAALIVSPFGKSGVSAQATSDERGSALLEGLPEGTYDLDVFAAGYSRSLHRGVAVDPGQTVEQKVVLLETSAVAGLVRDEEGKPVANAWVRGQSLAERGLAAPLSVRADAKGHYRLAGLAEGDAQLLALRSEHGAAGQAGTVQVRAGSVASLDLTLLSTATIYGRVLGAEPGKRVMVTAQPAKAFSGLGEGAVSALDAGGRYTVQLPLGRYRLLPLYPQQGGGGAGTEVEVGPEEDRPQAAGSKRVTIGDSLEIDLTMDPADDAIFGRVLEPGGAPSPHALVLLRRQEIVIGGTRADDDGHFRFQPASQPEDARVFARQSGRTGEVPLKPGELIIQLQPAARLRGRVTAGGKAVARFTLSLTGPDFQPLNWDITGGDFVLDDVPPGKATLQCTLEDGSTAAHAVVLQAGEETEQDLDVTVAARVHGRVVDPAGAPMPNLQVRLFPNGEGSGQSTLTSDDGSFQIPLPRRGPAQLFAELRGRRISQRFDANQDDVDLGTLVLRGPPAVPGTIGAWFGTHFDAQTVAVDGPAEVAGLLRGDVLRAVDGAQVQEGRDANLAVNGAPGTTVRLDLERDGKAIALQVQRAPVAQ